MLEERRTLEELARRSGGAFKAGDAVEIGVHPRDLYALRDEGFLVELSRGGYRPADDEMNPYLDLVAVSCRSPRGSICLNSALSFWDLTDEVPAEVQRGDAPVPVGSISESSPTASRPASSEAAPARAKAPAMPHKASKKVV